jgi:hypothetical protein
VELTIVGVIAVPLKVAVEEERKLVPVTVTVCAAAPATAEEGDIDATVGAGVFTVKLTAADEPPPGAGFVTTIG